MRKNKIVLDKETWDELCEQKRNLVNDYRDERVENNKLQKENGYLKALFDKEGDTQVIKYNGKLFCIVNIQHCKGDGEEALDISLVPVSEVC